MPSKNNIARVDGERVAIGERSMRDQRYHPRLTVECVIGAGRVDPVVITHGADTLDRALLLS